jgi:hypothetical protein
MNCEGLSLRVVDNHTIQNGRRSYQWSMSVEPSSFIILPPYTDVIVAWKGQIQTCTFLGVRVHLQAISSAEEVCTLLSCRLTRWSDARLGFGAHSVGKICGSTLTKKARAKPEIWFGTLLEKPQRRPYLDDTVLPGRDHRDVKGIAVHFRQQVVRIRRCAPIQSIND